MKRKGSEPPSRKRVHIVLTVAAGILCLVIGSRYSWDKPVSAAVQTTPEVQLSALSTVLGQTRIDCPEMKTHKTRPVHPAVFDKDYFSTRVPETARSGASEKRKIQSATVKKKRTEIYYHRLIEKIADSHQIDPDLIKAIVKAESSYNPQAISDAGAVGLMQLMPATAAELGVADSFNPEENLRGGIKYYKKMLRRFKGDIELALAAYNAGSSAVITHKGVPPYKETLKYIERVKTYYEEYKDQADSGDQTISPDAVQALFTRPDVPDIRVRQSFKFHVRPYMSV